MGSEMCIRDSDLGDKVKSREIENSSLRTTIGMLQEEIAALRGEASASEEE